MRYLFIFFILLNFSFIQAQVTNEGQPKSWKLSLKSQKAYSMPGFDLKSIQKKDIINDKKENQPFRFGYEHQVSFGMKDGEWRTLKNGDKVWLINIISKGAKTLNFLFDEFYIPEGAELYFYNDEKTDLLGAYTSSQNRKDMQFGSWLINGDNIWIEYYEPAHVRFKGQLHISKVVHGYRSVQDITELSKALNSSGPCNQDVDCPVGNDFEHKKNELKRGVALALIGSSSLCSGSLINNTNNDGSQYFLTANHCLSGSPSNWAFRFNWISPNPSCSTTTNSTNGSFDQTISGATLLANNLKSDFALLEIDAPLPEEWNLLWAGWDRSGTTPNFTVGIHHPRGDIMKVSRDNDSPVKNSRTFNGESNMENWFLNEWELGVTEPGSSGSPLFDQNGRIIGQLAGGAADCDGTSNNGAFDYYGRFDVSWDYGNTPSSRLKEWLDPENTGVLTLDENPPIKIFNNDVALIVDNISTQICGDEVNPIFRIQNKGNNTVTNAILTFQLGSGTSQTVMWSGSLGYLETGLIEDPILDLDSGNTLTASLEIDGITDEFTDNNTFSSFINTYENDTYISEDITLTLITDDFASETYWKFFDENGVLIQEATQGSLLNNTTYMEVFTVNPDSCYEFVILDSVGDGICCDYGIGNYKLETDSGEVIIKGGAFGSTEVTNFKISPLLSSGSFNEAELTIYPNPTSSFVTIESQSNEQLRIKLFDIRGKEIYTTTIFGRSNIELSSYPTGIYFLKIDNGRETSTKKIVKQ